MFAGNVLRTPRSQIGARNIDSRPDGLLLARARRRLTGLHAMIFNADIAIDLSQSRRGINDESQDRNEPNANDNFPRLRHH
jgi:hypothetical protein